MRKHTSRLLSVLLALCMALALLPGTALAAEANYDSIDIYAENRNVWTDMSGRDILTGKYYTHTYGLLDLEGDGIPELFVSQMAGTGRFSVNYYFKIDTNTRSVYEIRDIPESWTYIDLTWNLKIYRDNRTNQLFYYSGDYARAGMGYYGLMYCFFYLQNGVASAKPLWGENHSGDSVEYYYYSDSENMVKVSESGLKQHQEDYLKGYSLLAENTPVLSSDEIDSANDAALRTLLRGMYDELYQSLGTPAAPTPDFRIELSAQNLTVDDRENVACEKYNIDGSNYFKLRDLAELLSGTGSQFEVGYDSATGLISITTGVPYTQRNGTELVLRGDMSGTAEVSAQTVQINGVPHAELTAYNIGGTNFFQLRQLGEVLGFDVDYDPAGTGTAIVNSK